MNFGDFEGLGRCFGGRGFGGIWIIIIIIIFLFAFTGVEESSDFD